MNVHAMAQAECRIGNDVYQKGEVFTCEDWVLSSLARSGMARALERSEIVAAPAPAPTATTRPRRYAGVRARTGCFGALSSPPSRTVRKPVLPAIPAPEEKLPPAVAALVFGVPDVRGKMTSKSVWWPLRPWR